jgi:ATP-dependent Clp protease ATP-binding subunit ClpC
MFERFTEPARRLVFFGKYEATNMQSPYVEPEHLLLGLLRQDKQLAGCLLHSLDSIREKIKARPGANLKLPFGEDAPLSLESKRVLANAALVAENRGENIDTAHIFAGLRSEEKSFAAELLREALQNSNQPPDRGIPPPTF